MGLSYMSYCQFRLVKGPSGVGIGPPSCSLVESLIRNPCPSIISGKIDCSSYGGLGFRV